MGYISVSEASKRWNISLRQVQRLVSNNRISGARKFGKAWMIPADAEKPSDPRSEKKLPDKSLSDELFFVIASTSMPMPANNPDAILEFLEDERLRIQYELELSYLRGDFERALICFKKTEGDEAAKLRACYMAIVTAVSMGDYRKYTEIAEYLKIYITDNAGRNVSAFAEMSLAAADVSAMAPNMVPSWMKEGNFSALPVQIRPIALYIRAKYLQSTRQFEAMLTVGQTALALCESQQGITQMDIYFRVVCAIACSCLSRSDDARRWLMEAMNLALPHGFITPFAESIIALGGLVEQCLKDSFPDYYDAVLRQCESAIKNWITFHNLFTKDNITLILSVREYHIALLVAHRTPYAEIAEQYSITVGRLKNIMLEIYEKLFISGRDELAKYVF
ncbi:MAG: hypothetical protein K0Q48_1410 [Bacillota bacterium]|jgi:excisionase family DNA binding protein|nr:hypothetical protein [Bacillota bacterium]